jgi:hypothetical protein
MPHLPIAVFHLASQWLTVREFEACRRVSVRICQAVESDAAAAPFCHRLALSPSGGGARTALSAWIRDVDFDRQEELYCAMQHDVVRLRGFLRSHCPAIDESLIGPTSDPTALLAGAAPPLRRQWAEEAPADLKILMRLLGGQRPETSDGLFGSWVFYGDFDSVVMLSAAHAMQIRRRGEGFPVAYCVGAIILVERDGVWLHRRNNRRLHVADSVRAWLRDWTDALYAGKYSPRTPCEAFPGSLSRFPNFGPGTSVQRTGDIVVEMSTLILPAVERGHGDPTGHFVAYRCRMWRDRAVGAAAADAIDARPITLLRRRWVIRNGGRRPVDTVEGDGVIGMYPSLAPLPDALLIDTAARNASARFVEAITPEDCGVFEYCSGTDIISDRGCTVEGQFVFAAPVRGMPDLVADVAPFACEYRDSWYG